ncbi:hypothetical protein ANRL4_02470 [Anaerolineae bacterium]|nr:hypothetical protein ANRL4_02470 [Anaerolineae bacterium]
MDYRTVRQIGRIALILSLVAVIILLVISIVQGQPFTLGMFIFVGGWGAWVVFMLRSSKLFNAPLDEDKRE